MKILIIAHSVLNPYLGPSTVAHNTLKGFAKINENLRRNDINITFLSLNEKTRYKKITDNIEVVGIPRVPPTVLTGEIQALIHKRIMPNNRGFDIVHSHDRCEIFAWLNLQRAVKIYHLHGLEWKEKDYSYTISKISIPLFHLRLRFIWKSVDKVITISRYNVEELKKKGFSTNKVLVLENPVSDDFFEITKSHENLILYPARLSPRKNQLNFLKALSMIKHELKDYKVLLTGDGNISYFKILRNFVEKKDLTKIVIFTGRVRYEQLLNYLSQSVLVSLVSFEESFGMTVAEAMAAETAVIASRIPAIEELVTDGRTGVLVNPNNPREIADKLLLLINDTNLRKMIGKRAREEAERRWRAEKIVQKLLMLYGNWLDEEGEL